MRVVVLLDRVGGGCPWQTLPECRLGGPNNYFNVQLPPTSVSFFVFLQLCPYGPHCTRAEWEILVILYIMLPPLLLFIAPLDRAANPTLLSPSGNSDEVGELKRRVKKLEEAVAALQAVSRRGAFHSTRRLTLFIFCCCCLTP